MKTQTIEQPVGTIQSLHPTSSSAVSARGSHFSSGKQFVIALALLAIFLCAGKNAFTQQAIAATSPSGVGAGSSARQTLVPVFLATSLDSKKLKANEEVDAKTAATMKLKDGTIISSGTKVMATPQRRRRGPRAMENRLSRSCLTS